MSDWTQNPPQREPKSHPDMAKLWLENARRQLGHPSMSDDEYERLGHRVYGDDPEF